MNKIYRHDFLSALCILTFIGSSFKFVLYLLASLFFERTSIIIVEYSAWHSTDAVNSFYFTILMSLSVFSLIGTVLMWKLCLNGFYIYTAAQVLLLFFPVFWIGNHAFSVMNLIFTIIFICSYALNIKYLK
jgi:hypothetical protein